MPGYDVTVVPRSVQLFTVFLASPLALAEERRRVRLAADRLNLSIGRHLPLYVEVVGWEEVPSGAGINPQDVVNRYVRDEYDIFLGVMGAEIGSPTARAEAGTVEEYDRALERFTVGSDTVELMFYFLDWAVLQREGRRPSDAVQEFQKRVRSRVRYRLFADALSLENMVRDDLEQVVLGWENRFAAAGPKIEHRDE